MKIEIRDLCKSFGDNVIFDNFNISFTSENINSIIGESGGGKSTLLNILSGLLKKDSGEIKGIDEDDISYIFQEDRLVPWLNIKENMELFIYDYFSKDEGKNKIVEIFKLLHLENIEMQYPGKLSGGMRQRVNIARALLKPSKLILMDEPFKSIDYKTKYSIMKELIEILRKEDKMVIFVTHDVDEAIYMNGNIYVLGGRPFSVRGVFTERLQENKNQVLRLI